MIEHLENGSSNCINEEFLGQAFRMIGHKKGLELPTHWVDYTKLCDSRIESYHDLRFSLNSILALAFL